ncbi:MAG TPA: ATP-binding protein [Candidatus Dormibacteraeota bacterium]|nr:ATP-binding protein [Candidatus Dormibacteraeota bacterium]
MLVIVVAGAAGWFVHMQSDAEAKQTAVADATFAASHAAKEIALGFDTFRAVSALAAGSPSIGQVFTSSTACNLSYAPTAAFDAGHMDIVSLDGSVVCSSLKTAHAATYAGATWLTASSPVVVAPTTDAASGAQVAVYAYPIPGKGFLAWFLDLKSVGPKLASEYGSGVHQLEFLVTGGDGSAIVARSIDSGRWTGAGLLGTPFAQSRGVTDRNDVSGTARWYGQAVVEVPGWTVYAGADKAAALADAARLQNQQFEIVAVGLLAVLLGLAVVYRRVVRPIERLRASVRSSRGLESPPPVPVGGPAEVADLGEDINALITSLKHEWAERESAQQNYLRLFEGSPLPTLFFDPDGRFLEANDAAAAAFGYSRQELTELSISDLYAPRDAADKAEVAAAKARESNVRFGPIAVRKKDGTLMRVLVTTYEVLYGGRPARVSMVEDVTQREKLESQLNQSQRLESLGQLAGGVAHDFNNLLGVIVNFALFAKEKVLASGNGSPSPGLQLAVKDIDRVVRAGESAARLTHQLLAFARREVIRPQAVDVNSVVAELEPLVGRSLGEHIEFISSPGKDLWPALIDPGQLEQVLTNLLVNARDAMPQGGKLIVDCENVHVDDAYAAGRPGLKPGRYVRIRVTDTGTGMDAATLLRVFEPFFTTKPKGHGTGLGLATVYGIVNQAGGDVSIYSELGVGTRAHVLLPASDEVPKLVPAPDEPSNRHRAAVTPPPERASATLLVVEDAEDLREITELILTRNGYHVITASNGRAALDVVKNYAAKIDLLVTDVVMPHMQGPELARRVSAMHPEIRVLYMSGYAQPMMEDGGILEEGILLLEKPFTEPVLLAKVEQALRTEVMVVA